jgi:hypothetical protein
MNESGPTTVPGARQYGYGPGVDATDLTDEQRERPR